MVEQSTAAARTLANEANELIALVSRFQIGSRRQDNVQTLPKSRRDRAPMARGNLAFKVEPAEQDWQEF
jgi:methyl-accepting chemotaxis protein